VGLDGLGMFGVSIFVLRYLKLLLWETGFARLVWRSLGLACVAGRGSGMSICKCGREVCWDLVRLSFYISFPLFSFAFASLCVVSGVRCSSIKSYVNERQGWNVFEWLLTCVSRYR